MRTTLRIAGLALLALGVVPARADLAPRAAEPTPRATGVQEAAVLAVVLDPRTETPAVVLEGTRDHRRLAMAIGPAEATGIAVPLHGVTPPRPLTHDLFLTLFGRLKVSLTRVVITDLRDDIFYATVHLTGAGGEQALDARPSDAIALAIRAHVPVLVEDRVFDKAGGDAAPARGPRI
ncbi:MAG TPA: bifunctional nuclease family protein [Methylomirabilota bacterium]|nr:bifunctional nuclease family protein [Methylomirabilota bacterium]